MINPFINRKKREKKNDAPDLYYATKLNINSDILLVIAASHLFELSRATGFADMQIRHVF